MKQKTIWPPHPLPAAPARDVPNVNCYAIRDKWFSDTVEVSGRRNSGEVSKQWCASGSRIRQMWFHATVPTPKDCANNLWFKETFDAFVDQTKDSAAPSGSVA